MASAPAISTSSSAMLPSRLEEAGLPLAIVVPLEGAGGKLTSTISSPIQVHGVASIDLHLAKAGPPIVA